MWNWLKSLFGKKKKPRKVVGDMKTKEYWEQKHPVIEQLYSGRPLPTGTSLLHGRVSR